MDLEKIIEKHGKLIELQKDSVKYVEVMNITDLNYKYGISNKGWVVFYNSKITLITDDNYITLFKLLELPFENLMDEIDRNPLFDNITKKFEVLYPIAGILRTSLSMESDYWSMLSLEKLLQGDIYDDSLVNCLIELENEKWPSQKLKHKAKSYISKVRDVHWSNSKIKDELDS